jgi:ribosomal protein L37AE/L43A
MRTEGIFGDLDEIDSEGRLVSRVESKRRVARTCTDCRGDQVRDPAFGWYCPSCLGILSRGIVVANPIEAEPEGQSGVTELPDSA